MAKPKKRKDGLWYKQIELPPDGSGKRRRKYLYGRTQTDLAAKVRAAEKEIAIMGDMVTTSPALKKWLARWLDEVVTGAGSEARPKTVANYRHMATLITAAIGSVRLDKLRASHVRRLHTYIMREHPQRYGDGKGLSPSTAANAQRVLSKALNDAIAEGLAVRNVASQVDAPANPKSREAKRYLTANEARSLLLSVGANERLAIRYSLALMLGLRQGEALGLRVDHVDVVAGTITVEWQLQRADTAPANLRHRHVERDYYLTEVKTESGNRVLPMPPELTAMMTRYLPGRAPDEFAVWDGPRDARADEREWKRSLASAGLPAVNLHSARHSTLTLLAKMGVRDDVRRRIAGHASARITSEVYTHADAEDMRQAMEGMGSLAPRIEG